MNIKPHFCFLNYSKWSPMIDGYSRGIQIRACTICHKQHTRDTSYGNQVRAEHRNNAVALLLSK